MKKLVLLTMIFGVFVKLQAQDGLTDSHDITISVPEVAILDIEPSASKDISLTPAAPTEAGDPISFGSATNTSLWLNYSSIIGTTSDPSRTITVAITGGTVPAGLDLKVQAAADAGNGAGTVGTAAGSALTLTGVAQNIVTAIGSCYTNTPENNGHNLTYSLSLESGGDYADLDFDDSATVTVTYTISDN